MVAPAVSDGVENSETVLPLSPLWRGLFGMFGAIAVPPSLFRVGVPFPFNVFFPEKFEKRMKKMRKKNGLFAESVFGI